VALLGFSFHVAKINTFSVFSKLFTIFFQLTCYYFLPKHLHISIIFCTFVPVPESTQLTLFIHHLKHTEVMNKTWKTILQVISYVITLLLGGAAGNVMM